MKIPAHHYFVLALVFYFLAVCCARTADYFIDERHWITGVYFIVMTLAMTVIGTSSLVKPFVED
jgi:hypothetical protein